MNKVPDFYFIYVGVSQEGKTVKEALSLINGRIANLTKNLNSIEIEKKDYYIDLISQARLYDYKLDKNNAEQYDDGFEIKKNVIIKLNDINQFDKLVEIAAEQRIYDIIKVDYNNSEMNSIYKEMYGASIEIIQNKKAYTSKQTIKRNLRTNVLYQIIFIVFIQIRSI
ncbi:MAG: SIMPL domain-containing protein [Psychroserpens sp.]|uniref:SIMPL domain-containing protein n=1 Tax=Psychroserpens sp. TaxID=2020870 RepID=UPI003C84C61C